MKHLAFPLEPGTVLLGKYRIERLLGQGGMAVVYLAHHEMLQQDVAIKILLPDVAQNPENSARFLNEARAAVRLRNEHVATVMDVGTLEDGSAYIVLEYLDGSDLQQVLEASGPMPWKQVVDYVLQALEAVAQAHALGIVHRDLKPSNLFVTKRPNGTPILKVLDFGISKIGNSMQDGSITSTKTMLGSPVFMSPEQLRSAKKVDHRTDIWAIGVVFYHLLTGGFPYEAESIGELFAAVLEQNPASIRATRQDVPQELEAIYRRCLARTVNDRYPNVAELAIALEPLASEDGRMSVAHIRRTLAVGDAAAISGARPEVKKTEPKAEQNGEPAPPPVKVSTAANWSESLSTTKKSPVPRMAVIGGAVALCAVGITFAVWPSKAPAASVVGSTAVTTARAPEPPPTTAVTATAAPTPSAAAVTSTATATTATALPVESLPLTNPEPTHVAAATSPTHRTDAVPHDGQKRPDAGKATTTNADVLLMQRN